MEIDLLMAASYVEMSQMASFRDFMERLRKWTDEAESELENLNPEQKEHYQAYFVKWQQRKLLVRLITDHIEAMIRLKKEQHERPSDTDTGDPTLYTGTSGPYVLPGY